MPTEYSPEPQTAAEVAEQVANEAAVQTAAQAAAQEAEVQAEIAKALADAQKMSDQMLAQAAQGGGNLGRPGAEPRLIYEAQVAARRELSSQLRSLEQRRDELVRDISRANQNGTTAAIPGLEARLKVMDARIAALDAQVAQANLEVARAAAIPGSIQREPPQRQEGPPDAVYALGGLFIMTVFFPLAIAYARRLWKRGATIIAPVPADVRDRLESLTQAVEAIGIEVERIGEGQRFVTRVLGESRPVEHQLPVNRHVGVE